MTDKTITKNTSWQMFNTIASRYDLLNQILSLGLHHRWRQQIANLLQTHQPKSLLDLATGTGDVAIALTETVPSIEKTVGLDLAEGMLAVGRTKIAKKSLTETITLQHGDACRIDLNLGSFDAVTMSFGIRNVVDPQLCLDQIHRCLSDGGQCVILEFSLPKNAFIRWGHLFYLRYGVPFIGWLLSGNYGAYRYLNRTIEDFPYGEDFCQWLRETGFKNVQVKPLLFGVASLYIGFKK